MSREMGHVVPGMRRRRDDLVGGCLAGLAQRPQRGGARTRTAIGKDRAGAPLEHLLGLLDHVLADAFATERNVVVGETGFVCCLLDRRARRLIRGFPVRPVVDYGDETLGLYGR